MAVGRARQLPRGRHHLPREQVLASQRERMLRAMADAVAEKGFARVTVADVISRAGVSRETFYEHFDDKEACFLALLEDGARTLLRILSSVLAHAEGDPMQRLEQMLNAYLNTLALEPSFTKAFLIDAYGAGPAATKRRIELQQHFVDLVVEIFARSNGTDPGRFACEALVAALSSMVTVRVGSDRIGEVPGLCEPIMELLRRLSRAAG
jgi:TetR/AcrR family transcriptional regulator